MHPTPWHFWLIVTLAFFWHLFGCLDYTATQMDWPFWMQNLSARQELYVQRMPDWIDGTWAVSVWAGLLGALLMAVRARFAPLMLFISFIALTVLAIWAYVFATPDVEDVAGPEALWILVGAAVLGLLLWLYARAMNRIGVIG
ncbi:hypothetical protein LX81_01294 [Palleronia aestuarii]|uniref:DoxX-like protein n=1 Tax=Palleronia aestuarii TaxID=568105 RepID=A0A2W7Q730_9RHOB|nr:hypothetical protein [Palleronia aestuarii]PZX17569.1 hypothetical protein LX81_01294 [Palleronia aestuarii]